MADVHAGGGATRAAMVRGGAGLCAGAAGGQPGQRRRLGRDGRAHGPERGRPADGA